MTLVSNEQILYAESLVNYSIQNHTVQNIWNNKDDFALRKTGTLWEIVFADKFWLERPIRSFWADDWQDFWCDFILKWKRIDVKSMKRKTIIIKDFYVLNLPKYQIERNTETDWFCNICFNANWSEYIIVWWIEKQKLLDWDIWILYPKWSIRTRSDWSTFVFESDTYEILFSEMKKPS